ncbi:MAG: hypothetical protein ACFCAD_27800 [Pleurocapsa sp.]
MTSSIISHNDLEQFTQELQPGIDEGLNLSDVEYADGLWVGVFNEGRDSTWSYNPDLAGLESQIKTRWEQGYELTDVEYGDGVWFASFESGISSDSAYVYNSDVDGFTGQIREQGDSGIYRGNDLIDVEYGDGIWFGVLNDELGGATYANSSIDTLTADINSIQAQDYDLVDIEYVGNSWVSVFLEPTGAVDSTYTISNNVEDFNQKFADKLGQGYDLIDIEYGNSVWVGVFSGVITSTETNDNSTPSTNDVIVDSVIQSAILENTHYAFDPDYYFG